MISLNNLNLLLTQTKIINTVYLASPNYGSMETYSFVLFLKLLRFYDQNRAKKDLSYGYAAVSERRDQTLLLIHCMSIYM